MRKALYSFLLASAPYFCFAQTWHSLGSGINAVPSCFVSLDKLYIGTGYNPATFGGLTVNGICSFNGLNVDSLNQGMYALPYGAEWYNGKLIVGGLITCAGEPPNCVPNTVNIAAWDSINGWSSITPLSGGAGYQVKCVKNYNGELYAGGLFIDVNYVNVHRIAKWNGTTWSDVSGGVTGGLGAIYCMAVYHGQLYVGGDFSAAGTNNIPAYEIARWNGTQWDSVGGGFNAPPLSMVVDTVQDVLYAAGYFTYAGHAPSNGIARWNDTTWTTVGNLTDTLSDTYTLAIYNGELYAGGGYNSVNAQGDTLSYFCKYDGTYWSSPDGGVNSPVTCLSVFGGNLYVGGQFWQVGPSIPANHIACYGTTCPTSVGTSENTPVVPFRMYPNPNDDVLHIESEDPQELVFRLRSATGQLIMERRFTGELDYSTKSLTAGTYIVEVSLPDNSRLHMEKLVVK